VQEAGLLNRPEYVEALELWRQGRFWEVHEALEPLWQQLSGADRELTHGVILLAAALHKAKDNPRGGWRNFHKALKHLEGLPATYRGIRVAALIEATRQALEKGPGQVPPFPLL
jgi:predicted metal-dependent hydrolase